MHSKNCFDQISTWLNNDYKVSVQVRSGGNCGTTAEKQTIYDMLDVVVNKWKDRQLRRACATIDHEGGGRMEISLSSTSQPAYEITCSKREFWACKGNENGEPTCEYIKSIHDEL